MRGRDAILYRRGEPVARLLDLPWGEDDPTHWQRARPATAEGRIVLAGGLGPDNVADAIAAVRPVGGRRLVVAGGRRPGIKDHARVRAYVEAARS